MPLSPLNRRISAIGGRVRWSAAARRDAACRQGAERKGNLAVPKRMLLSQPPTGAAHALILPGKGRQGLQAQSLPRAVARSS